MKRTKSLAALALAVLMTALLALPAAATGGTAATEPTLSVKSTDTGYEISLNPNGNEIGCFQFTVDATGLTDVSAAVNGEIEYNDTDKTNGTFEILDYDNNTLVAAGTTGTRKLDGSEAVTVLTITATKSEDAKIKLTDCVAYGVDGDPAGKMQLAVAEAPTDTGTVTISGSVVSWNSNADAVFLLYPDTVDDATIRAEWKNNTYATAGNYVKLGTGSETAESASVDGKSMYRQTFSFSGVSPGATYKLVVFKVNKYVPKVTSVEVGSTAYDAGELKLWLYGDVNYNGMVNAKDAAKILGYGVGNIEFTADEKLAGDVNSNSITNAKDASHVLAYGVGNTSAFDSMK